MNTYVTTLFTLMFALINNFIYAQTNRPQTPVAPFPYKCEEVVFYNNIDSAKIAGTLTIPNNKGKHPVVILITGSGAQNRDEEIFEHKPFMVIADYLTKNGIAVLRCDDRAVGSSTRGKGYITTYSNARDIDAAVEYLKTRKEINKKKIGLIGHSEGGTIAFMLAAQRDDISFIVSLAGAGVKGDKVLLSQQEVISRAMGTPDKLIELSKNANMQLFDMINKTTDYDGDGKDSLNVFIKRMYPKLDESEIEKVVKSKFPPFLYYFIKLDPQDYIKKIKVPVLALNGNKDVQVISSLNLPAIENALKEGNNNKYQIVELDSLNHLFQKCKTGMMNEYQELEETISVDVLDIIKNWILKQ